jgi:hypothetical protein
MIRMRYPDQLLIKFGIHSTGQGDSDGWRLMRFGRTDKYSHNDRSTHLSCEENNNANPNIKPNIVSTNSPNYVVQTVHRKTSC